jgi:HPt (histidine-containing phosphotransfer) domain-containing protein
MNNRPANKTFTFSPPIDSQYLIELYAGDYVMIGETFSDVLMEYDDFVRHIYTGYEQNDRDALKSAVHKIKPLFGFVGLLTLQAECQDFENSCLQADPGALTARFNTLKEKLLTVRSVIQLEKDRLQQFIGSSL